MGSISFWDSAALESSNIRDESTIYFKDEMVNGIFNSFSHEHHFSEIDALNTLKKDIIKFSAPLGSLGLIAEQVFLRRYMTKFIQRKNSDFKALLENKNTVEQDAAANP